MLHISVKYKDTTSLNERITASMAIRKMINSIKSEHDIKIEDISDIQCEFYIDLGQSGLTRAGVEKKIRALLPDDGYEVIVEGDGDEGKKGLGAGMVIKLDDGGDTDKSDGEESSDVVDKTQSDADDTVRLVGGMTRKSSESAGANDELVKEIMDDINNLIGAEEFKKQAAELCLVAPKLRKIKGYFDNAKFLFSIDDGNGCSTACAMLARLLNALGLITKSKSVALPDLPYVDTPDDMDKLKANYAKMLSECSQYGVISIDVSKCYQSFEKSLYREFLSDVCSGEDMPIILFRIPYLEDQVRRTVEACISDQFLLYSVPFVPMSMDELYEYASIRINEIGYTFSDDMRAVFDDIIAQEKSDGKFYGFHTVDKLVRTFVYEKAKNDKTDSTVISPENLDPRDKDSLGINDLSGSEQLHALFGIDSVVQQIEDIVTFIEYAKRDGKTDPSFHMKFVGCPGTGKTTVARILGKMLKERGVLRTGVFFEYSGNDFIAQYVGHTAPKTAQMCRDAYGGILFIDEAYALSPGGEDKGANASFKQEALNTLLTEMENHRQDMIVIMAGYEEDLDELMQHNPGLNDRIPYTIRFENYSKQALADIFLNMAKKCMYTETLEAAVREYFENIPNNIYYSPNFANARYVRNLYERTVSKAVLRAHLEKLDVVTLTPADFNKAVEEIKSSATSSSRFGKGAGGARMFQEERAKIGFSDVCGQEEAKEMLEEIVDFLKHPDKYRNIGARVPKGALLYGPPGTGKTMLAKAVAGEAGVPVLTIAGSDFISSFVGEGADKVKELFDKARKMSPCIIFIDEIDAIGTSRTYGNNSSALMQLLTEMDGFDDDKTVIVLAATNRPDELDPALRRPGRFDREIPVELPDLKGRMAILSHYLEETSHEDEINIKEIANVTTGFSGAELRNIVNEAAHRALRMGRDKISTEDLAESVEVVMVGYVKKNSILSEHEKWVVCYHEIGHALVSALQTGTSPVKKITIVPRTGGTLGYVLHADNEQKNLSTRTEMENRIAVCVGGRAAEEVQFGEITTGASNDISQATSIARAMVATYGMTDEFDMVCFDTSSGGYLGGSKKSNCSEATARQIDEKVVEIVREQHQKAIKLLSENKELLDALSKHIHDRETITGEEFMQIFREKLGK